MNVGMRLSMLLPALAVIALPAVAQARGARPPCTATLDLLPARIDAPGRYCLTSDHAIPSGFTAVEINSNHVVLDCRGHALTALPSPLYVTGISIQNNFNAPGLHDVTVQNCRISGFAIAIHARPTASTVNRSIRLSNNFLSDFNEGVRMHATDSYLTDNILDGGDREGVKYGMGLESSLRNILFNNTIYNLHGAETRGIFISGTASSVLNNRIYDLSVTGPGPSAIGVDQQGGTLLLSGNTIVPIDGQALQLMGSTATCLDNVSVGDGAQAFAACLPGASARNIAVP